AGPRLAAVADCLGPTWASGAAPGPALREAADHLRRARRRAAREAAGRLGVRLVLPLGLCFLPAFVLVGVLPLVLAMAGGVLG
ncbi:MAG: type II secretion system F family protein, partial [Actinomycetes bacterium]